MADKNLNYTVEKIKKLLRELESDFWDVYVEPAYSEQPKSRYIDYERRDKETYLFYGTRMLYYKICLFFEYKKLPDYLNLFQNKFNSIINDREIVTKITGPKYEESEPSMIILDEFREFLYQFEEFDYDKEIKIEHNKLRLILEETNNIISKTKAIITNETSIYDAVRWYIELIYPSSRALNKSRFIKKFAKYDPDILIPEISSAVEYKYIRKGKNPNIFLDQLKNDSENYTGDPEYKFFYAVVFYEDKTKLTQASFKHAVNEKEFPENWDIIAL